MVRETYAGATQTIGLVLANGSADDVSVKITDAYCAKSIEIRLAAGETKRHQFALDATHGWYDFHVAITAFPGFDVQLAGHVENGTDSFTDPLIGRAETEEGTSA